MSPVILMLISGIFHSTLAINRLRNFNFMNGKVDWTSAKNECNERNQSLVTIYDQEDITFVQSLEDDCTSPTTWLGLHKSPHNVSSWSDGFPVTFNKSSANVANGEQICEAIENNKWEAFNCSDRKYFMCQRGSNYSLIKSEMNWCQARVYCRRHFQSDLVRISNDTQNEQVINEGQNNTFWIGLMHDEWTWEDNSCSTYREWEKSDSFNYTIVLNGKLSTQEHGNNGNILCSTGLVRIQIIWKNSTWEQAFDYCKAHHSRLLQIEDEQDQECVEQRLKYLEKDKFWIGLRQSRLFGFWIWDDKPVVYDHWWNDRIPEMPTSENCGVIETAEEYRWHDENCWYPHPFLCEEDISYMRYNSSKAEPDD